MRKRTALALAVVMSLTVAGTALATMPSGIVVTTFVRATLGPNKTHDGVKEYSAEKVKLRTKGATDVAMQTITSPPGGSSGWHIHPGIVLIAVQSGTVTRYDADCHTTQFSAGDAFVEVGNHPVLVRNNTTSNAVLYVTVIAPKSATSLRIDQPQPATCSAH